MAIKYSAGHFIATSALVRVFFLALLLPSAAPFPTYTNNTILVATAASATNSSLPASALRNTTNPALKVIKPTPDLTLSTNTSNITALAQSLEQNTNANQSWDTSDTIAIAIGVPFGILTLVGMALSGWIQLRQYRVQQRESMDRRRQHFRRRGMQSIRLHSGAGATGELGLAM